MRNVFRFILAVTSVCLSVSCGKNDDQPTDFSDGCEAVDLGLSVKWAARNVGAYSKYGLDNYFAWGETEEKVYYDWSKEGEYEWGVFDPTSKPSFGFTRYSGNVEGGDGRTVLEPDDDPATVVWGTKWRTPTREEINELLDDRKCEWTWNETRHGFVVKGLKTGNSIFLPMTGRGYKSSLIDVDWGYYWSSTLNESLPYGAFALSFYLNGAYLGCGSYSRNNGLAVRAVTDY